MTSNANNKKAMSEIKIEDIPFNKADNYIEEYANFCAITQNPNEFVISFNRIINENISGKLESHHVHAKQLCKIFLTPIQAFKLRDALDDQVNKFQKVLEEMEEQSE